MQSELPEIVIGEVINSNIRPWLHFPELISSVMISSYDLIKSKGIVYKIRNRGGLREYLELPQGISLWLDSGGYQIMKKQLNIFVEKIAWLYDILDADYYISLDYPSIPGERREIRLKKMKKTIENFDYLVRKLSPRGKIIVPVIHFSPKLEDYDYLINLYSEEYGCKIIAFGGFVPPLLSSKGTKRARLKSVLALYYVSKLAEKRRIHVMGLGSITTLSILNTLRIHSTDSAAWRVKAAYGKIILPWGGERHVTHRKVNFGRKKLTNDEFIEMIELIKRTRGFPFKYDDLKTFLAKKVFQKFEYRALFNAWIILTWAKKTPPKSGPFRQLYNMAKNLRYLSLDEIRELWSKLDYVKQSDLMKYIIKNT